MALMIKYSHNIIFVLSDHSSLDVPTDKFQFIVNNFLYAELLRHFGCIVQTYCRHESFWRSKIVSNACRMVTSRQSIQIITCWH